MSNGHDALNTLIEEGRERISDADLTEGAADCPAHAPMMELVRFVARCQIVGLERSRDEDERREEDRRAMFKAVKVSAAKWATGIVLTAFGALWAAIKIQK